MVRNESRFPGKFHANCGKHGTFGRSSQADRDQPIRLKLFADLVAHQLVLLSQVQFPVDHHRMRPAVYPSDSRARNCPSAGIRRDSPRSGRSFRPRIEKSNVRRSTAAQHNLRQIPRQSTNGPEDFSPSRSMQVLRPTERFVQDLATVASLMPPEDWETETAKRIPQHSDRITSPSTILTIHFMAMRIKLSSQLKRRRTGL